jgi:hypothetical protein
MTERKAPEKTLDLISIGRSSVDLYGKQRAHRMIDHGRDSAR